MINLVILVRLRRSAYFPHQQQHGIIKLVDHALLQGNDGVVRYMYVFRTTLRAALRDVAIADPHLVFQRLGPRGAVQGMHLQRRHTHKKARPAELLFLVVVAQNVADVLAQEALNTLAEFLYAVHIFLIHLPFDVGLGREGRDFFIDAIVPRDVGDQVFNDGERFHRVDGNRFVGGERIDAGLAGKPWTAIDLRRAGAALAGLAVPADSEIRFQVTLYIMQRIQNNHAWSNRDFVLLRASGLLVAPEHFQDRFRHHSPFLFVVRRKLTY